MGLFTTFFVGVEETILVFDEDVSSSEYLELLRASSGEDSRELDTCVSESFFLSVITLMDTGAWFCFSCDSTVTGTVL